MVVWCVAGSQHSRSRNPCTYVRISRAGVPIEHATFVYSPTFTRLPAHSSSSSRHRAHSAQQRHFSAVEAPCARCWRTCAHGDLQHWSPMQEQQGVYVCRASLSTKRGALCSLMNSSSRVLNRIWLTPHLPPALLRVPCRTPCSSGHAMQYAPPTL